MTTHTWDTGQAPFCPIMPTYAAPKVQFVRGEGPYLWDNTEKRYLDFLSGLAVTSLGHSHQAVTDAISAQAQKLLHVSNLFANEHYGEVAYQLDWLVGDGKALEGQVFFCNSGAEANEAAIKLSRRYRSDNRHSIISANRSFHGRTLGSLAATGQPKKWEGFEPLPTGFMQVPWQDIGALEQAIDSSTTAILLEAVQGEGGVNPASKEYFQAVRSLCDAHGLLFIVDEVQTGLARTGRWFGFQHFDVLPDIVTMAKALGNGMPIGACWAKAEVAAAFSPGDHASTYGGQPLATAAANAVLKTMQQLDAPRVVQNRSQQLQKALLNIVGVDSVRGLGLLLAVELGGPHAKQVAARCLELGLIVNAVSESALRLAPPFIIEQNHIDEAAAVIEQAAGENL